MNQCTNCGFNSESLDTFRDHSCLTSSMNWKERLEISLTQREMKAESRRDKVESEILSLIGETVEESLTSPRFNRLRNLFAEWESAEMELGDATERLVRLNNE
jgi:hypothetical protein